MCSISCVDFGKANLKESDIKGKSVIEVGAFNTNGSFRSMVESFGPSSYIGVDIRMGPGVDQICMAENIIKKFGSNRFDLLVCTEMLEHVLGWRKVVSNFKNVLKPEGVLIITTRSKGFAYHDCPLDFWRYEIPDMQAIFSDCIIEVIEKDPLATGVFIKVRKPANFTENNPGNYNLYSIILNRKVSIKANAIVFFLLLPFFAIYLFGLFVFHRLPKVAKTTIKNLLLKITGRATSI